jgi:hypothetical protein
MSPYYVLDESANTIKVPDLRGAYMAAAGFDSQAVGKTLADAIRNISGFISGVRYGVITSTAKAFNDASSPAQMPETAGVNPVQYMRDITLDASRIVPTATVNRPRSLTSYLCLYTGAPA